MATSFSGGGSQSTRREPPTMDKQLVNFITCACELSAPFFVKIYWLLVETFVIVNFLMLIKTSRCNRYVLYCTTIIVLKWQTFLFFSIILRALRFFAHTIFEKFSTDFEEQVWFQLLERWACKWHLLFHLYTLLNFFLFLLCFETYNNLLYLFYIFRMIKYSYLM